MIADARQIEANIDSSEWLQRLRTGDVVLVRNGRLHFRAPITDATPCYIFLGRLKFHRENGWQTCRQRKRVYRMCLRLVRTEADE